jgi:hypothetical protein
MKEFAIAWIIVGAGGGFVWSWTAYSFRAVVARVIVGCLLGPVSFLIAAATRR